MAALDSNLKWDVEALNSAENLDCIDERPGSMEVPRQPVDHRADLPDRSALLESLNTRFRGPLISFFMRRIGNYADAEDFAHVILLRILNASEELQIENAEAFVFKAASNLLLDRARQHARRGGQHQPLDEMADGELAADLIERRSPEQSLLARERLAEVVAALEELDSRTRDIFLLFRLEKMKHRQIAELFGISTSTVEKKVIKASAHLSLRFGRKK